ncbi:MAG: hypothetical protein Q4F41_01490 [Eubacteriales bacterium]|nr:hypothetical protein [Eubacteriales bacterium]
MKTTEEILLERILDVLTEEEQKSIAARLETDQASYHAFLEKLEKRKHPYKSTQSLAREITEELEEYHPLSRNFCTVLGEFTDRAHMKDPEVYRAIGMHRNQWSRIKQKGKRTSKTFILKLCIVLKLDLYEANYLMALAGYTFVPDDRRDYVICKCLREKNYDPCSIDTLLLSQDEEPLFSEDDQEEDP